MSMKIARNPIYCTTSYTSNKVGGAVSPPSSGVPVRMALITQTKMWLEKFKTRRSENTPIFLVVAFALAVALLSKTNPFLLCKKETPLRTLSLKQGEGWGGGATLTERVCLMKGNSEVKRIK